nr:dTDP-4-dehydrorhamnose 3,5-epimerase family protein [Ruminococcus sp. AM42-11]
MDTRQTRQIILTVPAFEDFRGYLAVPYDQSINFNVRQINQGYSKKAFTLRGLHFQEGEHAQAKLVSCLHGSIFNVAVDLRPGETSVTHTVRCCRLKTGSRCIYHEVLRMDT